MPQHFILEQRTLDAFAASSFGAGTSAFAGSIVAPISRWGERSDHGGAGLQTHSGWLANHQLVSANSPGFQAKKADNTKAGRKKDTG